MGLFPNPVQRYYFFFIYANNIAFFYIFFAFFCTLLEYHHAKTSPGSSQYHPRILAIPAQDPRNTIPGSSQYHPRILAIPTLPCGVKPHAARPRCARPVGVPSVAGITIGCLQTAQFPRSPAASAAFLRIRGVRRAPAAGCPSPRFCPPHSRHYLALPRAADCRVMAAKKDWGPGTLRRCVGNLPLFRLGPNAPFFAAAGVNRPLIAAAIGYPPPMSSGFLQGRRPAGERRPAAYC